MGITHVKGLSAFSSLYGLIRVSGFLLGSLVGALWEPRLDQVLCLNRGSVGAEIISGFLFKWGPY